MSNGDITDKDGRWKVTPDSITNLKTNEFRLVKGIPYSSLATMAYRTYMRKVAQAFERREWPHD